MGRRKAEVEPSPSLASREGVKRALSEHFLLRLHMTVILGGTIGAALAVTHLLLAVHLNNMAVRYGVSIMAAFAAFIVFVRGWLWYIAFCAAAAAKRGTAKADDWFNALNFSGGGVDVPSFGGGSSGGSSDGPSLGEGGGKFGGGGASGSWGEPTTQPVLAVAAPQSSSGSVKSSGGGKSSSGFSLDFDGDAAVLIVAIVFIGAVVVAAAYLIYAAPVVLSEAAFQATLAATLTRHAKNMSRNGWVGSIVRSTAVPFLIVLALGIGLGWFAQHRCPTATRLHEAIFCASR